MGRCHPQVDSLIKACGVLELVETLAVMPHVTGDHQSQFSTRRQVLQIYLWMLRGGVATVPNRWLQWHYNLFFNFVWMYLEVFVYSFLLDCSDAKRVAKTHPSDVLDAT